MSAQVPQDEVKAGAPEWVVTFGDMMSLLLCFFVLLLSFSTMEAQKFKVIAGFMREAFGLQTKETYTGVPMGTTVLSTDARTTTKVHDEMSLVEEVRRAIEKAGLKTRGGVGVSSRGVVLRLEGEVLFPSGEADLREEVRSLLDRVAEIAKSRGGSIEVEGHTDDVPIASARFPSNWELSTARAGAAVRYLIERGVPPSNVKAVGYADTRPIVPNTTAENRAKNRRVQFLFVRQETEGGSTGEVSHERGDGGERSDE